MAITAAQLLIKINSDSTQAEAGLGRMAGLLGPGGALGLGAVAAVAAVVGVGVASVKMAGDFQEGMTQLVTGAGESKSNLKLVSDGILQMARDTGTSTSQLQAGMYMIESAGYHGAAGLQVLQAAAQGAKVGNADLGTVADATTTIMTDFASQNVSASQAVNTLVATVAQGKTHMEDLSGALASALPTAASYKVHLNDVMGALSTMTAAGIPAADAATYLRQTLIGLGSPTAAAAKALASVGLTTADVNAEMQKSLPDTLKMITDAVGKKFPAGSVQYNEAIKAIAGGSKQMQGMLALTGDHLKTFQSDVLNIAGAVNKGGTSIQGWSDVQGDFNFKLSKLGETFQTLMISLGTKLLPVVGRLVDAFSGVLPGAFAAIQAVLVPLIGAFSDLFGNKGLGGASSAIRPMASTVQSLGAAFQTNLAPVISNVAKIFSQDVLPAIMGMAHFAVSTLIPAVLQFAGFIGRDVLPVLGTLEHVITTNVLPAVESIAGAILTKLLPPLENIIGHVLPILNPLFIALGFILGNVVGPVLTFLINIIGDVLSVLAFLVDGVSNVVGVIINFFTRIGTTVAYAGGLISGVVNGIRNVFATVWNAIIGIVAGAINTLVHWFNLAYEHSYVFKAIVDGIRLDFLIAKNVVTTIWHDIIGIFQGAVNLIGNIVKLWWRGVEEDFNIAKGLLGTAIKAITDGIINPLKNLLGPIVQVGKDLISGLINGIKNMAGAAGNAIKQVGSNMLGGLKSLLGIHSPSTVFAEVGANMGAGIVQGFTGVDLARSLAQHMASATAGITGAGASGGGALTPGGIFGTPPGMAPAFGVAQGALNGQPIQVVLNVDGHRLAQIVSRYQPAVVRQATGVRNF